MMNIPQAIGWTLIHFCWQAAAIAALYLAIAAPLARRSSQVRYVAALSSLLLMIAVAICTFGWELYSSSLSTPLFSPSSNFGATLAADLTRSITPGYADSSVTQRCLSLADLLPWIDGMWFVGVVALSTRGFGGWWYLRRLRNTAVAEPSAAIRESFDRVCKALELDRLVNFHLSATIDSPITMGALRAVVLLPLSAVTSLGSEELEVVLAHELAHVRRADFLWNILQTVAETLFFFHPAVWWINARIRHERELCCDDLALKVCPSPVVYAQALYRLEQQRWHRLNLAMALDGHASRQTLLMRISRILGEPMTQIPKRRPGPFSLAAAATGLVVLLLPVPHLLASFTPSAHFNPATKSSPTLAAAAVVLRSAEKLADPSPRPAVQASTASHPVPKQPAPQSEDKESNASQPHGDYIDRMKAAGYDVDLDKLLAMKIQGITPEYARAMATAGFGKPSADDLIACKVQGVTPEYIAQLKQQGLETRSFQDVIAYRIFSVTPDFVAGMKAAGFDGLSSKELLAMRVQGVTPEYASDIKKQFPGATADDLVKTRIFRIDASFIADAQKHGFHDLSLEKLVQLRISGLLDDESVKP